MRFGDFKMAADNKRLRLENMMTQERIPHVVMDEVTDGFGELSLKTKVNPTVKRMKINSSNIRFIMKTMGVFNQADPNRRHSVDDSPSALPFLPTYHYGEGLFPKARRAYEETLRHPLPYDRISKGFGDYIPLA